MKIHSFKERKFVTNCIQSLCKSSLLKHRPKHRHFQPILLHWASDGHYFRGRSLSVRCPADTVYVADRVTFSFADPILLALDGHRNLR